MQLLAPLKRLAWKVIARLDPQAALGDLFRAHCDELHRFAAALGGTRAGAEDAVSEVFLQLSADSARLVSIDQPRAYLFRAVRNQVLKARGRAGSSWSELLEADLFPAPQLPPEERLAVLQALRSLPELQRDIVFLKEVLQLSFREIAEALDIPLQTAASRHRYGLARLRQLLTETREDVPTCV